MSALRSATTLPVKVESSKASVPKNAQRRITRSAKAREISEGIGSKVRLCIGSPEVRCLPPFVLCKHFKIDDRGRPPHPARGAQSITYILSGQAIIDYTPSNSLELGPGDVASLMVGKGVVRSIRATETSQKDNVEKDRHGSHKVIAAGLQINVDVPEEFKRSDPSHLNLCHSDIAALEPSPGVKIKILTGSICNRKADQMLTTTPALILDCTLQPGANFEIPVETSWNAFTYVIEGDALVQGEQIAKYGYVEFMRIPRTSDSTTSKLKDSSQPSSEPSSELVVLSVSKDAKHSARLLFCAAEPLCQPIYRQGPFVDVSMNWIKQAFDDYSENKNGFETRELWQKHERERDLRAKFIGESLEIPPHQFSVPSSTRESSEIDDKSSSDKAGGEKPNRESKERSSPFNPCEDNDCENDDCDGKCNGRHQPPQKGKASNPNVFPPGKINPASNSTEFNDTECVEEQQRDKVPRKCSSRTSGSLSPNSGSARKHSRSNKDKDTSSSSKKRK